ncbi:3176_t:CDS:1 [Paraglomus occultum]|uniref:3176_t:CDS:1 n=1 Tax=Paraglomus occultum TaxID=144539 RepID=A0A9N9FH36_9GLOM|nr:3176_t:CDS:1 [Paraglomus occultum]
MSNQPSAARVVIHLLSKFGPQTTQQLHKHVIQFPTLGSTTYLKRKVLVHMSGQGLITKRKASKEELSEKGYPPATLMWFWYLNQKKIDGEKYKNMPGEDEVDEAVKQVDKDLTKLMKTKLEAKEMDYRIRDEKRSNGKFSKRFFEDKRQLRSDID